MIRTMRQPARRRRKVVDQRVPVSTLNQIDVFLRAQADAPVGRLLHRGSGWGSLYEKRIGRKISPGLLFETVLGNEERPWSELLAGGRFSPESLSTMPASYNVSPGWTNVLRESAQAHGATWLHHLHLGVAELEGGGFPRAREHFDASLVLKDNAPAHRCLALLDELSGDLVAAEVQYMRAWSLSGNDQNLAIELGEFLARHKRYAAFEAFTRSLPATTGDHERIVLLKAQLALERNEFATVRRLLQREYATVREGEISLSDLWFASCVREAERRAGRKLTLTEKGKLMEESPPPRRIEFRVQAASTASTVEAANPLAIRVETPIPVADNSGDTWVSAWAADGTVYSPSDDTAGFHGAANANIAFNKLVGDDARKLSGVTVNPMRDYGKGGQKGPDGCTWKSSGCCWLDGTIYWVVARHKYGEDSGDPQRRQPAANASIIKSSDFGRTWTRSAKRITTGQCSPAAVLPRPTSSSTDRTDGRP